MTKRLLLAAIAVIAGLGSEFASIASAPAKIDRANSAARTSTSAEEPKKP